MHWYGVTPPTCTNELPEKNASDSRDSISALMPSRMSWLSMQRNVTRRMAPRLSMKRACWPGARTLTATPRRFNFACALGPVTPSSPSMMSCCIGPWIENQILRIADKSSSSCLLRITAAACHRVAQQIKLINGIQRTLDRKGYLLPHVRWIVLSFAMLEWFHALAGSIACIHGKCLLLGEFCRALSLATQPIARPVSWPACSHATIANAISGVHAFGCQGFPR